MRKVHDDDREVLAVNAIARPKMLRWFAIVAIGYRICVLGIQCGLGADVIEPKYQIAVAMGVVLPVNCALLIYVLRRTSTALLNSPLFFGLDVSVAIGLNLWSASVIENGHLYGFYMDVFGTYIWATVALWAGVRGWRAGLAVATTVVVVMHPAMGYVNGFVFPHLGWSVVIDRITWMMVVYGLAVGIARLSQNWARVTAFAGVCAGREAERSVMLSAVHDTVLQTLESIALSAATASATATDEECAHTLANIRTLAVQQARTLRHVLENELSDTPVEFVQGLQAVITESGLRVELVSMELGNNPPQRCIEELLGVVREALTNVHKHSGTKDVIVRVANIDGGIELVVRDRGCGFDMSATHCGFGIDSSIHKRVSKLGGVSEVWSEPGKGTRVKLWIPA